MLAGPCPFFKATSPGAAPGPPVKTGARVRRFRGCNSAASKTSRRRHYHHRRRRHHLLLKLLLKVFVVVRAIFKRRQNRYAAARGDPDASPTFFSKYSHPWLAPNCPLPPRPKFLYQRFLQRALNVRSPLLVRQAQWQWRSTRERWARKGHGERSLPGEKGMPRRAVTRTRAPPYACP